jgi:hypothetical protein
MNWMCMIYYLPGHQRTPRWTRQQLFLGRVRRRANPWNAFLQKKNNAGKS